METNQKIGMLVLTAVALIVGLILLQSSAQNVGVGSDTATLTNYSFNLPSAEGGKITLPGQELLSSAVVWNKTAQAITNTSVYSIAEEVSSTTGTKRIVLTMNKYPTMYNMASNISYTYGVEGYIDDGGGRAVAGIIVLMFAIALAVVALYPTIKESGAFR